MVHVICDSCGKSVTQPVLRLNYFSILEHDLCQACHQKLNEAVEKAMASHPRYLLKTYHDTLSSTLRRMCKQ